MDPNIVAWFGADDWFESVNLMRVVARGSA
jgi:hypothetical protein